MYFKGTADRRIEPTATLFRGNFAQYAVQRGRIAREAAPADIVACEAFPGEGAGEEELLHFPMLAATLPVERSVDRQIRLMRSRTERSWMRRVLRQDGYTSWVDSSALALETFHATLHAPYLRTRFGAWGAAHDIEQIRRLYARRGSILFVAPRDRPTEPVCGALLLDDGTGVLGYQLNGFAVASQWDADQLAERTAALELALMKHAIDEQFARIDLGYTRAILDDGLFVHKRRLGCSFAPLPGSPAFHLHVRPTLRARVFSRYPLLAGAPGAFTAVLGFDGSGPRVSRRAWRGILKSYRIPGLTRAVVWTQGTSKDPIGETALREAISETLDLPDGVEFRVDP